MASFRLLLKLDWEPNSAGLMDLPSYSSDLDPNEELLAKIKASLRSGAPSEHCSTGLVREVPELPLELRR
jgi:transposase